MLNIMAVRLFVKRPHRSDIVLPDIRAIQYELSLLPVT